jgi:chromosome partitioning protein
MNRARSNGDKSSRCRNRPALEPLLAGEDPITRDTVESTLGTHAREAPTVAAPAGRKVQATKQADALLDTPPALGLRMSAALIAAHHVACPIELEEYSIDGVTDMLKTVFGVRQKYNPRLRLLGIIANRFNPHSSRQKAALASLIAHYDEFVIPAKISTRSAIPEALAAGVPVWRLAKSSAREASAEVLSVFELLRQRMGGEAVAAEEAA